MSAQYIAVCVVTGNRKLKQIEKNIFSSEEKDYTVYDRYGEFPHDFYKDYEYSDIKVDFNEYRVAWKK